MSEVVSITYEYILVFVAIYLLQYSCLWPARIIERKLAFLISKNFFEEKYSNILEQSIEWHKKNHSSSILIKLQKSKLAFRDFFQNGSIYFRTVLQFCFSILGILYFSIITGIVAIALGIITVLIIFFFDKPFVTSLKNFNSDEQNAFKTISDNLKNISTIKVLGLNFEIKKYVLTKIDQMSRSFHKNINVSELKWFFANTLVTIIYCITLIGYVLAETKNSNIFYVGNLVTLIGIINQFTSIFYNIAIQYNQILRFRTDIALADDFNLLPTENTNETSPIEFFNWQQIEINNLNFKYNGGKDVFVKTSFSLNHNHKVALIGKSGSGKSTLLFILKGLYKPNNDSILKVDNIKVCWESIYNHTTLFLQESEIFENTVRYNITLGLPFTDKEIYHACDIVKFTEILNKLPLGLDTPIVENGGNLSVGQKQRLGLARGVLAARKNDSSIILLDEPTSSIDPKTSIEIFDNLLKEFKDKLVICSLHHPDLLSKFQKVYSVSDGEIITQLAN